MSQTELHFGKLRKIAIPCSFEEWAKSRCQLDNIQKQSYNDTWAEQLQDSFRNRYFFVKDELWEVFDHVEKEDYDDIYELTPNPDGTYSFIMQFYNGGTCLSECIEEKLLEL